jgi:hypothetical protein
MQEARVQNLLLLRRTWRLCMQRVQMSEIRYLSLTDNQRAVLIVMLVQWLEEKSEDTHPLYQEALETFHQILKL